MLARCALAGSRPAEAISLLERAVAVQPQRPDFRINLALALERAGRIAEARVLLAGIPANSPAHTHAQRVLSRLSAAPR
jgi:putative thioredoxin